MSIFPFSDFFSEMGVKRKKALMKKIKKSSSDLVSSRRHEDVNFLVDLYIYI